MDDSKPLQITVEELYELIGRQLVEIRLLRARLEALERQAGEET
jgi:hypothetical protein